MTSAEMSHLRVTDWWISYIIAVYHVCGTPFQISFNVSGIQDLFIRLGLAVLEKHLTGSYRKCLGGLASSYVMCVTGT